jgi:hypothetical protein
VRGRRLGGWCRSSVVGCRRLSRPPCTRRRGRSFQVVVYAGLDPLTGRKLYLRESTTDEAEAQRILRRLTAQVDEQRHAKTNGSFHTGMEAWLRTHEVEETTRASYEMYARVHLYPAFGDEPIGKVGPRLLEEFYAELRRCSARCDGRPFVEDRVDGLHECRTVKHRRRPGRPPVAGYPPHDCAETGCTVVEFESHVCTPLSAATIRRIHLAVRGVLSAAERWGWITSNAAVVARKPRAPAPQPDPPTVAQAAGSSMRRGPRTTTGERWSGWSSQNCDIMAWSGRSGQVSTTRRARTVTVRSTRSTKQPTITPTTRMTWPEVAVRRRSRPRVLGRSGWRWRPLC